MKRLTSLCFLLLTGCGLPTEVSSIMATNSNQIEKLSEFFQDAEGSYKGEYDLNSSESSYYSSLKLKKNSNTSYKISFGRDCIPGRQCQLPGTMNSKWVIVNGSIWEEYDNGRRLAVEEIQFTKRKIAYSVYGVTYVIKNKGNGQLSGYVQSSPNNRQTFKMKRIGSQLEPTNPSTDIFLGIEAFFRNASGTFREPPEGDPFLGHLNGSSYMDKITFKKTYHNRYRIDMLRKCRPGRSCSLPAVMDHDYRKLGNGFYIVYANGQHLKLRVISASKNELIFEEPISSTKKVLRTFSISVKEGYRHLYFETRQGGSWPFWVSRVFAKQKIYKIPLLTQEEILEGLKEISPDF